MPKTAFNKILVCVIILAILGAIFNFFNFRSLWVDEAMLANSIVNKNFWELLKPLDERQIAPIGFLYIEHLFSILFNKSDWSLRIFPLFCYLVSIRLIYLFSKKLFLSSQIGLIAAALFAINPTLLYYSIEVKQYICDVFITLLLFVTALNYSKQPSKKSRVLFIITGVLSVWFSNIAIIILCCIALAQLIITIRQSKPFIVSMFPIIIPFVSFSIYYILFIYDHPSRIFMREYWHYMHAFPIKDLTNSEFYAYFYDHLKSLLLLVLDNNIHWFILFIFMGMAIINKIRDPKIIIFTLLPLTIHFILAYLELYPISLRLELYSIPLLISLLAAGLWYFIEYLNNIIKMEIKYVLLIPIAINLIFLLLQLPFEKEEIKDAIAYLDAEFEVGEDIYVYHSSKSAYKFYRNSFRNLEGVNYIQGSNYKNDPTEARKQYQTFSQSIWLIFSHVNKNEHTGYNDKDFLISKILLEGYVLIDDVEFEGAQIVHLKKI